MGRRLGWTGSCGMAVRRSAMHRTRSMISGLANKRVMGKDKAVRGDLGPGISVFVMHSIWFGSVMDFTRPISRSVGSCAREGAMRSKHSCSAYAIYKYFVYTYIYIWRRYSSPRVIDLRFIT
jgi:hypothetical protein